MWPLASYLILGKSLKFTGLSSIFQNLRLHDPWNQLYNLIKKHQDNDPVFHHPELVMQDISDILYNILVYILLLVILLWYLILI